VFEGIDNMVGGKFHGGCLFLVVLIIVLLGVPHVPVMAQSFDTPLKSGPFIDKLVFNVITQEDQRVLALMNDEIDLIGDMVDPSFIESLEAAENIETSATLRNGYGFFTINCAKYPFSITAFRRAMAFALDKEAISEDIWHGFSVPLDSCIPLTNPFSIEGQLPYSYYNASIALANSLLDAAGFADINLDGYRESPDGSSLNVLIEYHEASSLAMEISHALEEALLALQVDATVTPFSWYGDIIRMPHDECDIRFLAFEFSNLDVDWLAYEFWSEYVDEPFINLPNFQNASYDAWREQLLYSTSYDDVYEAAIEMQRIWVYECPMIICYENFLLSAYRTDRFEGHVNDWADGVPGTWTNKKIHLKADQGGPFGGTFRWSNSLDLDTFNLLGTSSAYTIQVLTELYDSMMTLDPEANDMMWLAESYLAQTHADNDTIPVGRTRFTFQLLQNANWTDGTPLTAEDVAFSLNFLRDAPGNRYRLDLLNMSAAYASSTYTVVVEFNTESYWHLHDVAFKPIFPKHIMQEIVIEDWAEWSPNPPVEEMVTSGPFNVSEYVAGQFIELTRNDNYFYRFEQPDTSSTTTSGPTNTTLPDLFELLRNVNLVHWVVTLPSLMVIVIILAKWRMDTGSLR
jgi:ABC-type transport system substrate-binding protein